MFFISLSKDFVLAVSFYILKRSFPSSLKETEKIVPQFNSAKNEFSSVYSFYSPKSMNHKLLTVISHIREKHISAVLISGKYIVPKSALVDFIVSDAAFEIVNKSPWHMNTILLFAEKE